MIYYILASILIMVFIYQIFAYFFKIPTLKQSVHITSVGKSTVEKNVKFKFLYTFSKPLAQYIPLSLSKELQLERMLQRVSAETPKEFIARLILTFIFFASFAIPLSLINGWIALLTLVFAYNQVSKIYRRIKIKAQKQHREAEKEIPRFIETFTHSIKTNRNVINIFDAYIQNYDSAFSIELSKTVADMRTG
ncbi:MAG: hypothetical protein RSE07_04210, partial [Oscillospiraceae bacterium]